MSEIDDRMKGIQDSVSAAKKTADDSTLAARLKRQQKNRFRKANEEMTGSKSIKLL